MKDLPAGHGPRWCGWLPLETLVLRVVGLIHTWPIAQVQEECLGGHGTAPHFCCGGGQRFFGVGSMRKVAWQETQLDMT
jgi:hypothetical protein